MTLPPEKDYKHKKPIAIIANINYNYYPEIGSEYFEREPVLGRERRIFDTAQVLNPDELHIGQNLLAVDAKLNESMPLKVASGVIEKNGSLWIEAEIDLIGNGNFTHDLLSLADKGVVPSQTANGELWNQRHYLLDPSKRESS